MPFKNRNLWITSSTVSYASPFLIVFFNKSTKRHPDHSVEDGMKETWHDWYCCSAEFTEPGRSGLCSIIWNNSIWWSETVEHFCNFFIVAVVDTLVTTKTSGHFENASTITRNCFLWDGSAKYMWGHDQGSVGADHARGSSLVGS